MLHNFHFSFFLFFFLPCRTSCRILVPQPGIEPRPSAVKAWSPSPNHWTAREFPSFFFKIVFWTWCNFLWRLSSLLRVHCTGVTFQGPGLTRYMEMLYLHKNGSRGLCFLSSCVFCWIGLCSCIYGQSVALLAGSVHFPVGTALTALSLHAFCGGLGNQITKPAGIVCTVE